MTVLVFDQTDHNDPSQYIQPLLNYIENLNATIITSFTQVKEIFEHSQFDFIIIDFSTKEGSLFLEFVLQHQPKQKIITLSTELISSEEDCSYCEKNFNKRRLIKPIEPIQLYKILNNFEVNTCQYLHHFNNPKTLVEDLLNRYDYFIYDNTKNIIEKDSYENDYVLKEYIDLVNTLKQYAIKYEILDNYAIKII